MSPACIVLAVVTFAIGVVSTLAIVSACIVAGSTDDRME